MTAETYEAIVAAAMIISAFHLGFVVDRREQRQRLRLVTLAWAYGIRPLARDTNRMIRDQINERRLEVGHPPLPKKS